MHPGFELKLAAGVSKDGYKSFDGCISKGGTWSYMTYARMMNMERCPVQGQYGHMYLRVGL